MPINYLYNFQIEGSIAIIRILSARKRTVPNLLSPLVEPWSFLFISSTESWTTKFIYWSKSSNFPRMALPPLNLMRTILPMQVWRCSLNGDESNVNIRWLHRITTILFQPSFLSFSLNFGEISIFYSAILLAVLVASANINFDLVEGVMATLNLKRQDYLSLISKWIDSQLENV